MFHTVRQPGLESWWGKGGWTPTATWASLPFWASLAQPPAVSWPWPSDSGTRFWPGSLWGWGSWRTRLSRRWTDTASGGTCAPEPAAGKWWMGFGASYSSCASSGCRQWGSGVLQGSERPVITKAGRAGCSGEMLCLRGLGQERGVCEGSVLPGDTLTTGDPFASGSGNLFLAKLMFAGLQQMSWEVKFCLSDFKRTACRQKGHEEFTDTRSTSL